MVDFLGGGAVPIPKVGRTGSIASWSRPLGKSPLVEVCRAPVWGRTRLVRIGLRIGCSPPWTERPSRRFLRGRATVVDSYFSNEFTELGQGLARGQDVGVGQTVHRTSHGEDRTRGSRRIARDPNGSWFSRMVNSLQNREQPPWEHSRARDT